MILTGSVEALEDAGDGGDLVEAQHSPWHVGQHKHHEDDHHNHRHSDISPILGRERESQKVVTYLFIFC